MARDIRIHPKLSSTASNDFPRIDFGGLSASTISLRVDDDGSVVYSGTYGVLFNVSDSKDGLLHSVNDISGLPILQVYSYDYVQMGKWDRNAFVVNSDKVGIGLTSPSAYLHISSTNSSIPLLIASGSSTTDLVRLTQAGSGNTFVVEDSTNPDATPFVISNRGDVGIGAGVPTFSLDVTNLFSNRMTAVGIVSGTAWSAFTGTAVVNTTQQKGLVVAQIFTSSSTSNTTILAFNANNNTSQITSSQQALLTNLTWDGTLGQFATISSSTVNLRASVHQVQITATFGNIVSSHGVQSAYQNAGTGSTVQFFWAYTATLPNGQFGTTNTWGAYYVPDLTSITGNGKPGTFSRWGLRIEDPSNNWLAGRLGIGSGQSTPTLELQINGTASIGYIKMTNGSGTAGSVMISGDSSGTNVWSNEIVVSGSTSSSNATPQTICVIPTLTDTTYTVWAYVAGKASTGATAGVGGRVDGTFRNASGVLTSVGVSSTVNEDFSAGNPTFTLTTSGTNILLQVTGFAGQNISWSGVAHYIVV